MIQSTSNLSGYYRADSISISSGQKSFTAKAQPGVGDSLSSANTSSLREALAQTSEIRPEVVARGKALAVDLSYPPRQILEGLAKLMVDSRDPSSNA
ncbi:MAG: hypothetical protein IPP19_13895 [Verrucomicrobia bacterium]|nr:hypothetical protein [Verrucomicrobiota bacterium]